MTPTVHFAFRTLILIASLAAMSACETNGWLIDPQRTGYFQTTPTAIPILTRIDVIEQAADTSIVYTQPSSEDLIPNQLEYKLAPGDVIRVSIPQLISADQTDISTRVIDQSGRISLPIIGQMPAAGLTVEQVEEDVKKRLAGIITNPKAFISVEEARAYQFRVLGSVEQPGLFALNKPDLRVLDALALARGAAPTTTRVLITRAKATSAQYENSFTGGSAPSTAPEAATSPATGTTAPVETGKPAIPTTPPASAIDDLINALPGAASAPSGNAPAAEPAPEKPAGSPAPTEPPPAPTAPPAASEPAPAGPSEPATEPKPARMGMLGTAARQEPPVDIDSLEPAKAKDEGAGPAAVPEEGDRFVFDPATQAWVKMGRSGGVPSSESAAAPTTADASGTATTGSEATPGLKTGEAARARTKSQAKKAFESRVIEIDYNQLVRGAANLNVIIRPDDMLYCDTGDVGVVYIDGLIARPGVYNLPTSGKLTLSRLVAAAGGLGELAIPQRVDLVRRIGTDKEACIRVNLAAIRNRSEPDIFLRPDDHINIGTNFWATPLAVIRNGFRMTYGFGFLVDRNWGNDIFGAPPVNVVGN
jgi:protein involved in polysaccharide export with SLBB domain